MVALIVISLRDNLHRASAVLDGLRVLDGEWISELRDALAVHRDLVGERRMDQTYQPTSYRAAGWEGALGLLIGATLSFPLRNVRAPSGKTWQRIEPFTPRPHKAC